MSEVQAETHKDSETESEISVDAVVVEIELNSNSKTLVSVTTDITNKTAGAAETEREVESDWRSDGSDG